jgi:hypothetical protein
MGDNSGGTASNNGTIVYEQLDYDHDNRDTYIERVAHLWDNENVLYLFDDSASQKGQTGNTKIIIGNSEQPETVRSLENTLGIPIWGNVENEETPFSTFNKDRYGGNAGIPITAEKWIRGAMKNLKKKLETGKYQKVVYFSPGSCNEWVFIKKNNDSYNKEDIENSIKVVKKIVREIKQVIKGVNDGQTKNVATPRTQKPQRRAKPKKTSNQENAPSASARDTKSRSSQDSKIKLIASEHKTYDNYIQSIEPDSGNGPIFLIDIATNLETINEKSKHLKFDTQNRDNENVVKIPVCVQMSNKKFKMFELENFKDKKLFDGVGRETGRPVNLTLEKWINKSMKILREKLAANKRKVIYFAPGEKDIFTPKIDNKAPGDPEKQKTAMKLVYKIIRKTISDINDKNNSTPRIPVHLGVSRESNPSYFPERPRANILQPPGDWADHTPSDEPTAPQHSYAEENRGDTSQSSGEETDSDSDQFYDPDDNLPEREKVVPERTNRPSAETRDKPKIRFTYYKEEYKDYIRRVEADRRENVLYLIDSDLSRKAINPTSEKLFEEKKVNVFPIPVGLQISENERKHFSPFEIRSGETEETEKYKVADERGNTFFASIKQIMSGVMENLRNELGTDKYSEVSMFNPDGDDLFHPRYNGNDEKSLDSGKQKVLKYILKSIKTEIGKINEERSEQANTKGWFSRKSYISETRKSVEKCKGGGVVFGKAKACTEKVLEKAIKSPLLVKEVDEIYGNAELFVLEDSPHDDIYDYETFSDIPWSDEEIQNQKFATGNQKFETRVVYKMNGGYCAFSKKISYVPRLLDYQPFKFSYGATLFDLLAKIGPNDNYSFYGIIKKELLEGNIDENDFFRGAKYLSTSDIILLYKEVVKNLSERKTMFEKEKTENIKKKATLEDYLSESKKKYKEIVRRSNQATKERNERTERNCKYIGVLEETPKSKTGQVCVETLWGQINNINRDKDLSLNILLVLTGVIDKIVMTFPSEEQITHAKLLFPKQVYFKILKDEEWKGVLISNTEITRDLNNYNDYSRAGIGMFHPSNGENSRTYYFKLSGKEYNDINSLFTEYSDTDEFKYEASDFQIFEILDIEIKSKTKIGDGPLLDDPVDENEADVNLKLREPIIISDSEEDEDSLYETIIKNPRSSSETKSSHSGRKNTEETPKYEDFTSGRQNNESKSYGPGSASYFDPKETPKYEDFGPQSGNCWLLKTDKKDNSQWIDVNYVPQGIDEKSIIHFNDKNIKQNNLILDYFGNFNVIFNIYDRINNYRKDSFDNITIKMKNYMSTKINTVRTELLEAGFGPKYNFRNSQDIIDFLNGDITLEFLYVFALTFEIRLVMMYDYGDKIYTFPKSYENNAYTVLLYYQVYKGNTNGKFYPIFMKLENEESYDYFYTNLNYSCVTELFDTQRQHQR